MERLTKYRSDIQAYDYISIGAAQEGCAKLGRLEDLEEEMGCPLYVRCNITDGCFVYNSKGIVMRVETVYGDCFIAWNALTEKSEHYFYKEYKITWCLKEDRSE